MLGAAFMAMSLVLTAMAAREAGQSSVVDQIGADLPAADAPDLPGLGGDLLPPSLDDAPLVPSE
jgi:preprotein translocase subunit SecG